MAIFFPQQSQLLTFFLWSGCCGVQNPVWRPCFVLPHCNTFTDVEDVKFVINYDYPNSSEDYIHRIGRTARSQKTGTAYTFFTPNNMKQASDLISVLREANQAINPKLIQMAEDRGGKASNMFILIAYTQKVTYFYSMLMNSQAQIGSRILSTNRPNPHGIMLKVGSGNVGIKTMT